MVDVDKKANIEKRQAAILAMDNFLRDEIPFNEDVESFSVTAVVGEQKILYLLDNKAETAGASKAILALAEYLEVFKEETVEGTDFVTLQDLDFGELLEKAWDEHYRYRPTLAALMLQRAGMIVPELQEIRGDKIEIEIIVKE